MIHPRLGAVAVLAFALASCGKAPSDRLVGTWLVDNSEGVGFRFDADGSAHGYMGGKLDPEVARWKLEADRLMLEQQASGTTNTLAFKADFKDDNTLQLAAAEGKRVMLLRRSSPDAMAVTQAAVLAAGKRWRYRQDADQMRGTVDQFATVSSNGNLATMTVRNRSTDGLAVMLDAPSGAIFACLMGCEFSIRFDDGPVSKARLTAADNDVGKTVFFSDPKKILAALRTSKRMMVEAFLINAGRQQFQFDVSDLKWQ